MCNNVNKISLDSRDGGCWTFFDQAPTIGGVVSLSSLSEILLPACPIHIEISKILYSHPTFSSQQSHHKSNNFHIPTNLSLTLVIIYASQQLVYIVISFFQWATKPIGIDSLIFSLCNKNSFKTRLELIYQESLVTWFYDRCWVLSSSHWYRQAITRSPSKKNNVLNSC